MNKEIDLIKCIIYEIDKNLYSDFGGNLCISYTPDLKKLLLALNTPEIKYYFDNQDQQIADLQHRLEVAEKTLNEMSNYAINDNDLYDLISDFNIENERYDEDHFGIDTCDVVDYFKEQAEKEVRGEKNE